MKVLVTGGAGYVGSTLTPYLVEAGHSVRVLDTPAVEQTAYGSGTGPVEYLRGDIRHPPTRHQAVQGVEAVVHLAALVLVRKPRDEAERQLIWEINYEATRSLVDICKSSAVRRFIFASTCSNYGVSDDAAPATEEAPLRPTSPYAEAKVAAEHYLLSGTGGGFHPTVLRLATVFGVSPRINFEPLLNTLVREAVTTGKLELYGPKSWRPFVHVQDVARAVRLVLEAPLDKIAGQVYNVGADNQNYQKGELALLIRKYVPHLEIAIVGDTSDARDYRVSFKKIQHSLGFQPHRRVEDGIQELVQFLKESAPLGPTHSS